MDDGSGIKHIYNGKRSAPRWPSGFSKDHEIRLKVKNKQLLDELHDAAPEERGWEKVYENGYLHGRKLSIHYFRSSSGKVFDLEVHEGWSYR